jgi:mono/diheme cytochrome c family protein
VIAGRTGLIASRAAFRCAVIAACIAALIALGGCGRASRLAFWNGGARADSSFATLTSAHGRSPLAISISNGKLIYDRYCAICHGESGGGDGFNAYNVKAAFDVNPTAFSDSATMAGIADSVAIAAIAGGGPAVGKSPAMPPWGHTLTASEQSDVWHFARSLAPVRQH